MKAKIILTGIISALIVGAVYLYMNAAKEYVPQFTDTSWEVREGEQGYEVYEKKGTADTASENVISFIHADTTSYKGPANEKTSSSEFFKILEYTTLKETQNYTVYALPEGINPECIGIYRNKQHELHLVVTGGVLQPGNRYTCDHFDFEAVKLEDAMGS
jgi:hypothetical protein